MIEYRLGQTRNGFIESQTLKIGNFAGLYFFKTYFLHPSVEKDLSLKIEVRDQAIWTSTPEL